MVSAVPPSGRLTPDFLALSMSPGGTVALRKIPTVLQGRAAWKLGLATVDVIATNKSAAPCRT